jgi:type II secretory pathway pseudopilin PulG
MRDSPFAPARKARQNRSARLGLDHRAASRLGVTILELLVVIVIIAMLVSLLFPVLSMLRESSLRTACENNVRQLYLAMESYSDIHRGYMPFPAVEGKPSGWAIELLPFMEEIPLYNSINTKQLIAAPGNAAAVKNRPPLLVCPVVPEYASTIKGVGVTHYLLVVDPKERHAYRKYHHFRIRDVPEAARYPWCTSPEIPFENANYPPPHNSTSGVFGLE